MERFLRQSTVTRSHLDDDIRSIIDNARVEEVVEEEEDPVVRNATVFLSLTRTTTWGAGTTLATWSVDHTFGDGIATTSTTGLTITEAGFYALGFTIHISTEVKCNMAAFLSINGDAPSITAGAWTTHSPLRLSCEQAGGTVMRQDVPLHLHTFATLSANDVLTIKTYTQTGEDDNYDDSLTTANYEASGNLWVRYLGPIL
jgi:hypothetical protein